MNNITYQPVRASELDPKGEIHIFIGAIDAPDSLKTCIEAEGNFSPGVGTYGIYIWLYDCERNTLAAPTFGGVPTRRGLSPNGHLIPWVEWDALYASVGSELCSVVCPAPNGEVTITTARVRVTNQADSRRQLRLYIALRPLGPAGYDVHELSVGEDGMSLLADSHPAIVSMRTPEAAGVSAEDSVGMYAREGAVPPDQNATSASGDCSGALAYDLELAPSGSDTLELIFPVQAGRRAWSHRWDGTSTWFQLDEALPGTNGPLQPDPGLAFYRALSVGDLFAQAIHYWEKNAGATQLDLPDPRWNALVHAANGHFGMMLNDGNPDLAPVNLNVFNRDLSYMANLLEKLGNPAQAETFLRWYLRYPFSGRVEPEADNPGQILWTLADHWRFTRNTTFLCEVYPFVRKLAAMIRYLRTTPEPHYVYDDTFEFGDTLPESRRKLLRPGACDGTHPEYTEAFDIAGLRHAADMAEALGKTGDATESRTLADELFQTYDNAFAEDLGREYGSFAVLWPCRLYPFDDPKIVRRFGPIGRMDSTTWRYFPLATAHQGLFAGSRSAGYETINSHLAEEQMVGWYTFDEGGPSGVGGWPALRTTWSCSMKRDDWAPLSALAMPDGWGIAELWLLMRDSLVYEYDDQLVLFSGIDPVWFTAERPWEAHDMPTWYGSFSCRWQYRGQVDGTHTAELHLSGDTVPPKGFRLVLPEPFRDGHVRANVVDVPVSPNASNQHVLPPAVSHVLLTWS